MPIKPSFKSLPKKFAPRYKKNQEISAPRLLVISSAGDILGEMTLSSALALAREEGLDLVEMAPNATPPVGKIISWSKFKYEQEKKHKNSKGKSLEQKEIWFKAFIGEGDLQHKLKKIFEFLEKRHPVKLSIRQRGRVPRQLVEELMGKLVESTKEYGSPVTPPRFEGYNYSVTLIPKK